MQTVADRHGRVDIVIANAGIGAQGTVADNSDDEWQRVLDVNVIGVAARSELRFRGCAGRQRRPWS